MLKGLYKTKGIIKGWYRGLLPSMIGSYPGQVVYYVSFEMMRDRLRKSFVKSESFADQFLMGRS
jgi:hypothetical protein